MAKKFDSIYLIEDESLRFLNCVRLFMLGLSLVSRGMGLSEGNFPRLDLINEDILLSVCISGSASSLDLFILGMSALSRLLFFLR